MRCSNCGGDIHTAHTCPTVAPPIYTYTPDDTLEKRIAELERRVKQLERLTNHVWKCR